MGRSRQGPHGKVSQEGPGFRCNIDLNVAEHFVFQVVLGLGINRNLFALGYSGANEKGRWKKHGRWCGPFVAPQQQK
jgi:hypothetical protein